MKIIGLIVVLALIAASVFFAGSDIDISGGKASDVNVNVATGEGVMPEYEVIQTDEGKMPSVHVGIQTDTGDAPTLDIATPDVTIDTSSDEGDVISKTSINAAKKHSADAPANTSEDG